MKLTYTVSPEDVGAPFHEILVRRLACSRLLVKRIRLHGELLVNGQPRRMKELAKLGDQMVAHLPQTEGRSNPPMDTPLLAPAGIPFLYQDAWSLVCNKPAQLVTHPTYLHQADSLTEAITPDLLHPVNRLDRDTTGLVLIAKNGYAHHVLAKRPMEKTYLALVHGSQVPDSGTIDLPIARAPGSIMLREINHETGQPARTHYQCLRRWPKARLALLRLRLETGRTHQLRLHCLMLGHPIVGETLYGAHRFFPNWPGLAQKAHEQPLPTPGSAGVHGPGANYLGPYQISRDRYGDLAAQRPPELLRRLCWQWDQTMPHQALHAYKLQFCPIPLTEAVTLYAPLPASWTQLLQAIEAYEEEKTRAEP